MNQTRQVNPFSTALIVGLGWGLLFGLGDGLPILLELPILPHLRERLQALAYFMAWSGIVGTAVLGLLGLAAWGGMRLLGREIGRRKLAATYSGLSFGLASLAAGLHDLKIPIGDLSGSGHATSILVLVGLGGLVGLVVGLGLYGWAGWWQSGRGWLRPLRWKRMCAGTLGIFLASVAVLLAMVIYQNHPFRSRPSGNAATPAAPNVLLITIDTLRADRLGVYGYDPEISPHIDALAARGITFDQAIAQAPWTAPSVASFITSLYPTDLGIHYHNGLAGDLHVDEARVTLAEALHDAGYHTQAFATNWHIIAREGFNQGFDGFESIRFDRLAFDRSALHERTLVWLMCQASTTLCDRFDRGYDRLYDPGVVLWKRNDPLITQKGLEFLRWHKDERFFLWLYYIEPHSPYSPPRSFRPLPDEITPARERFLRQQSVSDLKGRQENIRPVDLQAMLSLYDGEIAATDALVGQVMHELERQGLVENTLVILLSDHGEEFLDHGNFTHGHTLYDELVRVPFIISGPGVQTPGRTVQTQVRLLDLLPTVCDLAGVPVPPEAKGHSLRPLLQGAEMDELAAFSESLHSSVFQIKSIRQDGYKLIYDPTYETVELYDVRQDPREQVNLADAKPEIVEAMLPDLKTWIVQSAQTATELPRQRPLTHSLDDEMRQRLRDAGY
jgi:arylsulfatase A-like enzyme